MPSRLMLPRGDDYPTAARRHLEDAEVLLGAGPARVDGAAYLLGYVIECTLKSLVVLEHGTQQGAAEARRFGHDLSKLSVEATRLAALAGSPHTAKYLPRFPKNVPPHEVYREWRETLRYEAGGVFTEDQILSWWVEARWLWEEVVRKMFRDGVA